jgi:hypothetical protein
LAHRNPIMCRSWHLKTATTVWNMGSWCWLAWGFPSTAWKHSLEWRGHIPCRKFRHSTQLPLLNGTGSQYDGGEDAESSKSDRVMRNDDHKCHQAISSGWYHKFLTLLSDASKLRMPAVSGWENINDRIFMQEGAPPHFTNDVRVWLDEKFPGHWLGRRGPHEWPARSPDLTHRDFLRWGWAKDEVYCTKPSTLEELQARIRDVITNVQHNFLQKTVDYIPSCLRKLVDITGAYTEF